MPVKNEDWILEKTLCAISLWADHIIVADQKSTDKTIEIVKKFSKVHVVVNNAEFHSSSVRKLLLDEARKLVPGNNLIFSFDADEIPTADIITSLEKIKEACNPGDSIELQWLNLWKSTTEYRDDASVFSNSWKVFGFVDDRKMEYVYTNPINDHASRVPIMSLKNVKRFNLPKVLHYQFSNWERTLSKQCYYRMIDFIYGNQRFIDVIKINHRYFTTRNTSSIKLSKIKKDMVSLYEHKGIHMEEIYSEQLHWMDIEVLKKMSTLGPKYFSLLDIWYVDWEKKRLLAIKSGEIHVPNFEIKDPRNMLIKIYHSFFQGLIDYNSNAYAIYRKLRRNMIKR